MAKQTELKTDNFFAEANSRDNVEAMQLHTVDPWFYMLESGMFFWTESQQVLLLSLNEMPQYKEGPVVISALACSIICGKSYIY